MYRLYVASYTDNYIYASDLVAIHSSNGLPKQNIYQPIHHNGHNDYYSQHNILQIPIIIIIQY